MIWTAWLLRKSNFNILKYCILSKRVLFNIIRYNTRIALIAKIHLCSVLDILKISIIMDIFLDI